MVFSLMLSIWEAEFPEMGFHYVEFQLIGNIPFSDELVIEYKVFPYYRMCPVNTF